MKYQADDGEVFEYEQDCIAHEARIAVEGKLKLEVDKYVDGMEWQTWNSAWDADGAGRARNRLKNTIMSWLRYDTKERPFRYQTLE